MGAYDLVVLGGGPAGYNAAERAAKKGMSVCLLEKNELGGVCLNEGCVPSKTLLNSAKVFNYVCHSENYGVQVADKGCVSQEAVIERKTKVVKRLVTGVKAKLKGAGVTVIKAEGCVSEKTSDGFIVIADGEEITATNLLIATGSSAVIPNIKGLREGLDAGFVLTNREVLNLTAIPQNFVIIGGGVIGLEMADYYATVGSKVTVVEMADKIAGNLDKGISDILQKALSKKGIEFLTAAEVTEIAADGVVYRTAEGTGKIDADKILLSIGRRANTQNVGLENIGVELCRGCIVTNDKLQTTCDGAYAAGDVNGKVMLAHTAYREGEVAVNNMLGISDVMNYSAIPSVIYTSPEVASVGETAETAAQKGINAKTIKISLMYSGRYIAENTDYTGVCQLVADSDKNTLIGAQIIGSYASEYIVAVSSLIDLEVDIERVKKLIFPHPTVAEVIREAVFEI